MGGTVPPLQKVRVRVPLVPPKMTPMFRFVHTGCVAAKRGMLQRFRRNIPQYAARRHKPRTVLCGSTAVGHGLAIDRSRVQFPAGPLLVAYVNAALHPSGVAKLARVNKAEFDLCRMAGNNV